MQVLGLDIGGANLKAALSTGEARSIPFPLWKIPDRLPDELVSLTEDWNAWDALAVTMTGELADCFRTKAEGVGTIVAAAVRLAGTRPVGFWSTEGEFLPPHLAVEKPVQIGAANWHALATWLARSQQVESGLLIDVGSTTTDIIPLQAQKAAPRGKTDLERLHSSELIYTGVSRTPLCAVTRAVTLHGHVCPLAAELFATTRDVYLILGLLPEDSHDLDTANQRPATVEFARERLARMVCCDTTELTTETLDNLATQFAEAQQEQIVEALRTVTRRMNTPCLSVYFSGTGTFLKQTLIDGCPELAGAEWHELDRLLSPDASSAACAVAAAQLGLDWAAKS